MIWASSDLRDSIRSVDLFGDNDRKVQVRQQVLDIRMIEFYMLEGGFEF